MCISSELLLWLIGFAFFGLIPWPQESVGERLITAFTVPTVCLVLVHLIGFQ